MVRGETSWKPCASAARNTELPGNGPNEVGCATSWPAKQSSDGGKSAASDFVRLRQGRQFPGYLGQLVQSRCRDGCDPP